MSAIQVPDAATLLRVLGNELRTIREQRGWVRRDVQTRLAVDVSLQTLASYELGTRSIGVVRFAEVCAVLETSAPKLLERALEQVAMPERVPELRLDLRHLADTERPELVPLRRWAQVQLDSGTASPATARLSWPALERLAELCGLPTADLVAALRDLAEPC